MYTFILYFPAGNDSTKLTPNSPSTIEISSIEYELPDFVDELYTYCLISAFAVST